MSMTNEEARAERADAARMQIRFVVVFEIKDQVCQYYTGRFFSEVLMDAEKYGTRQQANGVASALRVGFRRNAIHVRKVRY